MIKKFLKEEKAQGAIEYILLAGGIIVAAVVIFAIYSQMTSSAGDKLANATNESTEAMSSIISKNIATMG
jgi:uncharacterized protein (UPF0333 family)